MSDLKRANFCWKWKIFKKIRIFQGFFEIFVEKMTFFKKRKKRTQVLPSGVLMPNCKAVGLKGWSGASGQINKYIHEWKGKNPSHFLGRLGRSSGSMVQLKLWIRFWWIPIFSPLFGLPPPLFGLPTRGVGGPKMANFGRKKSYFSVFKNYFSKKLLFPKNEKNRKK